MSTFKYCPLIWEFCGKTEKIHINKIHKRILRLIYDTEDSTFEDLLVILLVKIYKSIHYISPPIFKYNLRGNYLLKLTDINICRSGTKALYFKRGLLWNNIPNKYRNLNSLEEFRNQIKQWNPTTCSCKICK